ncbi:restriction endonuclease subunit S [Terribacillus saccharophilus]|nr:restriction endonuclease subunit S [Terribacillus saccharophilus]
MKETAIGTLPADWNVFKLSELGTFLKGKGIAKKDISTVGSLCILYGELYTKYHEIIKNVYSKTQVDTTKCVSGFRNDVLIPSSGETAIDIATASALQMDGVLIGGDINIFRPKENVYGPFISYLINSTRKRELAKLAQGSSVYHLYASALNEFQVALPSLNEQQRITEILSTVDEQIENTLQLIEKTKELKKGLMQQLLTKGIGHTKFKQTELGEIPEEWEVLTFANLLDNKILQLVQDGNHGEKHPRSSEYVSRNEEDAVPFLMATDVKDGRINYKKCNFITFKQARSLRIGHCFPGDIILTHKGSVGRVACVGDEYNYLMLSPQVTFYRIAEKSRLNPLFLKYFFESEAFQNKLKRISFQTTRSYIGIGEQKKQSMLLPNISEQKKIVTILSTVDEQIEMYQLERENYRELKKGLMQQLLTGKVRVKV